MKKILFLSILFLALFCENELYSQVKIKDLNSTYSLVSTRQILDNDMIQGYYNIYLINKPKKGVANFAVEILDENGNSINQFEIIQGKTLMPIESSYENGEICFMFYDSDKRTRIFQIYNVKGELVNEYKHELTKAEDAMSLEGAKDLLHNSVLFNIPKIGFFAIDLSILDKKYYAFKLIKFPTGQKTHIDYSPDLNSKFQEPEFLGFKDDMALFSIKCTDRNINKDLTYDILAVNINTWKKEFRTDGKTLGENLFLPEALIKDPNTKTISFFGPYYDNEENPYTKNAKGVARFTFSPTGEFLSEDYRPWKDAFKSFLTFDERGKSINQGFIKIHTAVTLNDGTLMVIGEGYGLSTNAGKILKGVLLGENVTQLDINDIVIGTFDKDFNFIKGTIIDKYKNKAEFANMDGLSAHRIANMLYEYGAFDFNYIQQNETGDEVFLGYYDAEKVKKKSGSSHFKTVHYANGQFINDQVKLDPNASYSIILPNTFGKVLVLEYFKDDKKINTRVTKLK